MQDRTLAALGRLPGSQFSGKNPDASSIKALIVKISRQRIARSKITSIEMERRSFLAHFKNVRGWGKKSRKAKWLQIEANPSSFRTSMAKGHLTVWVPQNPEVSLEELLIGDVSDAGRSLNLDKAQADHVLRGVGGGVAPCKFPTAVVGGPARVDDGFGAIFQDMKPEALAQNSCLQRLAPGSLTGMQRSLSGFSLPGPSASEKM